MIFLANGKKLSVKCNGKRKKAGMLDPKVKISNLKLLVVQF